MHETTRMHLIYPLKTNLLELLHHLEHYKHISDFSEVIHWIFIDHKIQIGIWSKSFHVLDEQSVWMLWKTER